MKFFHFWENKVWKRGRSFGQFLRNKNYFISDHSSFEIKFENYRSISIFKIFLDEMEFLFTFSKINFSNEAILSCSSNFQILSPLSEKRKRSCNISFSRFCTASPCIYTYILYTVSNVVARERDREKLKILERGGSKKRETLYGGSNNYVCTCMCVCVHGWVTRVGRSVTDQPWNPGLGSPLSGLIIRGSTRESFEKFLPANFPSPPTVRSTVHRNNKIRCETFAIFREKQSHHRFQKSRQGLFS